MDKREKRRIWLMAGIALIALLILAAGLSELKLSQGWPLSVWWQLLFGNFGMRDSIAPASFDGDFTLITRILAILILLLIPLFIVAFILYPDVRKRMLREALRMIIFLLLASLLMRSGFMEAITRMVEPAELTSMDSPDAELPEPLTEGLPEFEAQSPSWLIWAASFVLALALAAGIAGLFWSLSHRQRSQAIPMQELAQEAQAALDALQAGADFRNTIIRCYREMSEMLRTQRGIRRDDAMTPREFEARLTQHGLPGDPVRQLTRLFEWVRYGAAAPTELEEDQAITSLSMIVEACRSAKR